MPAETTFPPTTTRAMTRSIGLIVLMLLPSTAVSAAEVPATKVLYDFEGPADAEGWSNLSLKGAKPKEPAAKITL